MALNITGKVGWWSGSVNVAPSQDADALAFITAANITDSTQKSAINTLVTQLKTYGIWTKMKAIYPFVGGTAAQHRFNLKDPRDLDAAFRLVFAGGWTHSSTGITGNGTNTYADTKFNPFTSHPFFDVHYSMYSRTDTNGGGDMGGTTSPGYVDEGWLSLRSGGYAYGGFYDQDSTYGGGSIKVLVSDSLGMYVDSAIAKNNQFLQKNNTILGTWTSNSVISMPANTTISIGAIHDATANTYVIPATREYAFASFGFGLTTTEAANFYTAVQTFQTTLGRQVGVPIVADTDAQAFLNAAVITNQTQASAINTLVTDLKSANIWTKMKAIYPFVGGTATTHKFNLKDPRDLDAAYRLVFNGGWTHSSTGALPNGTTAYADTKLIPNANLTQWNTHLSYYSRTSTKINTNIEMGSYDNTSINLFCLTLPRSNNVGGSVMYSQGVQSDMANIPAAGADSFGFFIGTRTSNVGNSHKLFLNQNIIGTASTSAGVLLPNPLYIGALRSGTGVGFFSNKETAFSSIGDGLTDAEATAFYNAVQAYQTTLGRQV